MPFLYKVKYMLMWKCFCYYWGYVHLRFDSAVMKSQNGNVQSIRSFERKVEKART